MYRIAASVLLAIVSLGPILGSTAWAQSYGKAERRDPLAMPKSSPEGFEEPPLDEAIKGTPGLAAEIPPDLAPDLSVESLHTVQPGETLFRIGRKYHVSVENLRKWNNLLSDTIEVGQKLIIAQP